MSDERQREREAMIALPQERKWKIMMSWKYFFKISVRIISTERILIRTLSILALFLSLSHAATLALTHTHTYTPYPTESHIVTAVTHSYSLNTGMLYMPLSLNNRVKHLHLTQHTQPLTVSPTLTPNTTHTILHNAHTNNSTRSLFHRHMHIKALLPKQ